MLKTVLCCTCDFNDIQEYDSGVVSESVVRGIPVIENRVVEAKYLCSEWSCFGGTLKNFVVFLGEALPKNRACLSEEPASLAILAEQAQALEKQEIILRNGKTRPFTNFHTLNSYVETNRPSGSRRHYLESSW